MSGNVHRFCGHFRIRIVKRLVQENFGKRGERTISRRDYWTARAGMLLLLICSVQTGRADDSAAGYYTRAQAARGKAQFIEHCAMCHAENLAGIGSAPALSGAMFQAKWASQTVGDLFIRMSTTMPQNQPGSLKPDEYADIEAFLLRANNFPAGSSDLSADSSALKRLPMIGGKP